MVEYNICQRFVELGFLRPEFLAALPRHDNFIEGMLLQGVPWDEMTRVFDAEFGMPSFTQDELDAELLPELVAKLPRAIAERMMLPVSETNGILRVAMANPFNRDAIEDAELVMRIRLEPVLAHPQQIRTLLSKYYGVTPSGEVARLGLELASQVSPFGNTRQEAAHVQNAPAVRIVDKIIEAAISLGASDIHIEPFEKEVRTRFRIDGRLVSFEKMSISLLPYIIARLKVLSGLNISEMRLPQDGHIAKGHYSDKIDFRISTMPNIYGEKAAIRLIYSAHSSVDKNALGFFPEDINDISGMFRSGHGAVLVTGPTGSGKTTTLTAFLNELNTSEVNIVTIEDPVENAVYGINQISINPKAGLDFANALRSIVRQDPDIIMVGEIRDRETAKIAAAAAMTGHLVLSTLHTYDAASAIIRLTDMGVEHYMVAATLNGIISQRLVRRLCAKCKKPARLSADDAKMLRAPQDTEIFEPVGCAHCNNTGYKGRLAVYEYILVDEGLRELIAAQAGLERIKKYLNANGMKRLRDNAVKNFLAGRIGLSELYGLTLDGQ